MRTFGRRENRAAPHYRTRDGVWEPGDLTDDDAAAPAGGVSSNLRDLDPLAPAAPGRAARSTGRQVVASEPLRETHRPQIVAISPPDPATGPTAFYGLGWTVSYDDRGRLELTHGGDFTSYSTQATLLPAAGLGILVLCNGGASAVRGAIPRAFLEMVTKGEPSQDWVSAIETSFAAALASILATSTPFPQGKPPADAAPPLALDVYTGAYTNTRYGEVTVRESADGLVLQYGSSEVQHRLFPWDRDVFSMPLTGDESAQIAQLGVLFTIGPDGQADAALVSLGGVGLDAAETFTRLTEV